jgi:hypothetical protein
MRDKFIVPQFIDAEDKIWGPITVRQFIIVMAGGLLIFLCYKLSDFGLFIFETVIISLVVALFAFYRFNGAPFHVFALNFVQTFKKPRIRVWLKEYIKVEEYKNKDEDLVKPVFRAKPLISGRKLSELSLIIDTGGVYRGEQEANQINNLNFK